MELVLERLYFKNGTNGRLTHQGQFICYTIECPWLNNQRQISCIPEGNYNLFKRYSKKWGWHLEIKEVINRSLILIHPANHALKELQGCIAPVTNLTGQGTGNFSRVAFEKLKTLVFQNLNQKIPVTLTIQKSSQNDKEGT